MPWWMYIDLIKKDIYFIECVDFDIAVDLLNSNYGAVYDGDRFSSFEFSTLDECLEYIGAKRNDIGRKHGGFNLFPLIGQKSREKDGETCVKCNNFYPYADGPNQPDGTFKCYGCRCFLS